MAVTHSNAALSAATDAVTALISTSGNLVFRASPSSVSSPGTAVATLALATPNAFGSAVNGVATAGTISNDTSATGGTIAYASLQTSGGTIVIHCAVGTSGSDINLTSGSLTITAGDTVQCSALTYKAISA